MPEKNVFGLSMRVVSCHEFGVVYYVLPRKLAHEYDASRTLILRQHRKNELLEMLIAHRIHIWYIQLHLS